MEIKEKIKCPLSESDSILGCKVHKFCISTEIFSPLDPGEGKVVDPREVKRPGEDKVLAPSELKLSALENTKL